MFDFLRACVEARLNIFVSGGTGSGKTTTLNVISAFVPEEERIITIEDAAELQLRQEHVITLEARPANLEGEGEITTRDLLRNSLHMRPDRIIVGECRGGEALDMIQAMTVGQEGSLSTGHANSSPDMLRRLETMILMAGYEMPLRSIREQIASAVDLIVHTARLGDGSRKIVNITEVYGIEDDQILTQDIFEFKQTGIDEHGKIQGTLEPSGIRPTFMPKFKANGIAAPPGEFGIPPEDAGPPRQGADRQGPLHRHRAGRPHRGAAAHHRPRQGGHGRRDGLHLVGGPREARHRPPGRGTSNWFFFFFFCLYSSVRIAPPKVLLVSQPTRGVDLGATQFIWRTLTEARDAGAAVLLSSADLSELLALSDRLVVFYRGRIVAAFRNSDELDHRDARRLHAGAVEAVAGRNAGGAGMSDASPSPRWTAIRRETGRALGAAFIALAVAFVIILFTSKAPLEAFSTLITAPITRVRTIGLWIDDVAKLTVTGLAFSLVFQARQFAIGVQGQVYVGALAASYVALSPLGQTWLAIPLGVALRDGGGRVVGLPARNRQGAARRQRDRLVADVQLRRDRARQLPDPRRSRAAEQRRADHRSVSADWRCSRRWSPTRASTSA